jgi:hypothetical protein
VGRVATGPRAAPEPPLQNNNLVSFYPASRYDLHRNDVSL